MTTDHDETKQMQGKYSRVSIELSIIKFNDEQWNELQPVMSNDTDVNTEQIETISDDEMANENVAISRDSSHIFDTLLNSNRRQTSQRRRVTLPVDDAGNLPVNSMSRNRRVVELSIEEFNVSTAKTIGDINAELGPVVGYAEEPLLPLYKACAPLTGLLHNLYFYIQIARNETPEVPADGLTIDESAAIRLYTIEWDEPHRSLYWMLNRTLQNDDRTHLRPYFKFIKLFLTALAKLPCAPPSTVWRGVTEDVRTDFPCNASVTMWGFSSCTTALPVLQNNIYLGDTGSRTLFSIEVINARKICAHSHFPTEDEVLLLPGTLMIVQSQFSPASDLHLIHLKQIIPEEVLLEPPFEGIFTIIIH